MGITSKAMMYQLYKEFLRKEHPGQLPVTLHFYEDCLRKHFPRLHITKPKSDTCSIRDAFFMDLKNISLSIEEKSKIQTELDLHQVTFLFK